MGLAETRSTSARAIPYRRHSPGTRARRLLRDNIDAQGRNAAPWPTQTDPVGCNYNSYRNGQQNFYGPSKTIDTSEEVHGCDAVYYQHWHGDGYPH